MQQHDSSQWHDCQLCRLPSMACLSFPPSPAHGKTANSAILPGMT
ncbi:hypothetical protein L195_g043069 [Trifolium pratense]|uniref:Uncharacterized protein n=1 Tax=Trifolium pratense TaxID=57577 RepID=A0A2K3M858_TRIPR|nr:hypothetical protein L195_g043069 [Trifolium pratense]